MSSGTLAALRSGCALLPTPCCELVCCSGADAVRWLQGLVSNDLGGLADGQSVGVLLLDATGHARYEARLVLLNSELHAVLEPPPEEPCVLLITEQRAARPIAGWLDQFLIAEDARITVLENELSVVSIQGPLAEEAAGALLTGCEPAQVVDHNRCGPGGCDIVMAANAVDPAVAKLLTSLPSAGADDWELSRIEAGIPRWPAEFGDTVLAPELGIYAIHISTTKGCYIGQEIVARIQARGHTNRRLCRLTARSGRESLVGAELLAEDGGAAVGRITSAADNGTDPGVAIALGFVRHEHAGPGRLLHTTNGVECLVLAERNST